MAGTVLIARGILYGPVQLDQFRQPRPDIGVFEQQAPLFIGRGLRETPTFIGKPLVGREVVHHLASSAPHIWNLETELKVPGVPVT